MFRMKNPFNKKKYIRPELVEVELDKMIVLQVNSDGPPIPDDDIWNSSENPTSTSDSTDESFEKSSFEDNPFQR
ncbi:hypothetical protein [Marinilabilia salmonicolor]|uniref:hypothetical protein n=2 Tax=Marinilabilia salmonicolor TaxID=989 RepID=UPI0012F7070B|nr:hypothetical protein [Marinilabilia salmonicolor]